MHADRTNRLMLALSGLVVLAAGAAGMAASTGAFGASFSRRTLFANQASSYIGHHGVWLWPAVAGACLLLALVAVIGPGRADSAPTSRTADTATQAVEQADTSRAETETKQEEGQHDG